MSDLTPAQIMRNQLSQYQAMPLSAKVKLSKKRIEQWLEHWDDKCYIAFSGGKDSTVLLDLVWSINPRIPAVFVDTGLEYPEVREFVKSYGDRVTWLKPAMRFDQVIRKYGYPVIGKDVSMGLDRYRNTKSDVQKSLRLHGGINPSSGKKQQRSVPIKYHYLVDAPFKCSEKCCDVMKKRPFASYEKSSGRKSIVGTMTGESNARLRQYRKFGCSSFDTAKPQSRPMAFWTEQDVLQYISKYRTYNGVCSVYGTLREQSDGSLKFDGEQRTGCMFCMFGVQFDGEINRFQRMYKTHPKQWDYCINKLECGKVLDFINVKYVPEGN